MSCSSRFTRARSCDSAATRASILVLRSLYVASSSARRCCVFLACCSLSWMLAISDRFVLSSRSSVSSSWRSFTAFLALSALSTLYSFRSSSLSVMPLLASVLRWSSFCCAKTASKRASSLCRLATFPCLSFFSRSTVAAVSCALAILRLTCLIFSSISASSGFLSSRSFSRFLASFSCFSAAFCADATSFRADLRLASCLACSARRPASDSLSASISSVAVLISVLMW